MIDIASLLLFYCLAAFSRFLGSVLGQPEREKEFSIFGDTVHCNMTNNKIERLLLLPLVHQQI